MAAESVKTATGWLTEIIKGDGPRASLQEMEGAVRAEVKGLKRRNVWKKMPRLSVPKGTNVKGARFVNAIKDVGTSESQPKGGFVVLGHGDKEKNFLVHNTFTMRQTSTMFIVLSFCACCMASATAETTGT